MAGLVFGNSNKLTSSIQSINFESIPSAFCSFVIFEINSACLEYILSLSSFRLLDSRLISFSLLNW